MGADLLIAAAEAGICGVEQAGRPERLLKKMAEAVHRLDAAARSGADPARLSAARARLRDRIMARREELLAYFAARTEALEQRARQVDAAAEQRWTARLEEAYLDAQDELAELEAKRKLVDRFVDRTRGA